MKNPKFYEKLVDAANAWYRTAKTELGLELNKVANALVTVNEAPSLPAIVCLCGSTRFYEQFQKSNFDETMAGRIVLSVGCFNNATAESKGRGAIGLGEVTEADKVLLDVLHKRKIDLADEVLVLNVNGYIGDSTRSEVEYARATGKPVRWLNFSADVVVGEMVENPPETVGSVAEANA